METLHPFLQYLEEDPSLGQKVWEAFVEGRKASLPDWSRRSLSEEAWLSLACHLTMWEESFIRDLRQVEAKAAGGFVGLGHGLLD